MNFAILLTFLCSALLVVIAQDQNMPVNPNETKTTSEPMQSGDDHSHDHSTHDHSMHDQSTHDHSMPDKSSAMPGASPTNSSTVNDPSAQGSKKGAAVAETSCLSFVILAAVLPRLL